MFGCLFFSSPSLSLSRTQLRPFTREQALSTSIPFEVLLPSPLVRSPTPDLLSLETRRSPLPLSQLDPLQPLPRLRLKTSSMDSISLLSRQPRSFRTLRSQEEQEEEEKRDRTRSLLKRRGRRKSSSQQDRQDFLRSRTRPLYDVMDDSLTILRPREWQETTERRTRRPLTTTTKTNKTSFQFFFPPSSRTSIRPIRPETSTNARPTSQPSPRNAPLA